MGAEEYVRCPVCGKFASGKELIHFQATLEMELPSGERQIDTLAYDCSQCGTVYWPSEDGPFWIQEGSDHVRTPFKIVDYAEPCRCPRDPHRRQFFG